MERQPLSPFNSMPRRRQECFPFPPCPEILCRPQPLPYHWQEVNTCHPPPPTLLLPNVKEGQKYALCPSKLLAVLPVPSVQCHPNPLDATAHPDHAAQLLEQPQAGGESHPLQQKVPPAPLDNEELPNGRQSTETTAHIHDLWKQGGDSH